MNTTEYTATAEELVDRERQMNAGIAETMGLTHECQIACLRLKIKAGLRARCVAIPQAARYSLIALIGLHGEVPDEWVLYSRGQRERNAAGQHFEPGKRES